ncbi:MAG: VWA domain-containing protein [Thermoplasmata archaeon]
MPEESARIKRIRKKLPRKYGCQIYERDFNLAVRFPKRRVSDIDDNDVILARESLEITGLEEISEKTVSSYIIADTNYLEVEIELFIEAVEQGTAAPILSSLVREESQKRDMIDSQIRNIVSNLSQAKASKELRTSSSGGAKVKSSYVIGGRGRVVRYIPARRDVSFGNVAIIPTIRKAIQEGSFDTISGLDVKRRHLQEKVYRSRTRTNICLIMDTSFYSDDIQAITTMEWLLRVISAITYEKRGYLGIVSFSGNRAKIESAFTTDVDRGGEVFENFEFGGLTPLASGFKMGFEMLERQRGDREDVISIMVLIARGKANVPLFPGGFIRRELIYYANRIKASSVRPFVIHIGVEEENLIKELAFRAGARYYHPPLLNKKITAASEFLKKMETKKRVDIIDSGKSFLESLDN